MGLSYVVDPTSNKTFFTFYSEFDKAWEKSYILANTILGVLFFVSLCGNLLVISFFVRFKAIRQVTNLFITNLAVSDLIFSVMVPLVMTTRVTGDWIFGEVLCHMLITIEFVSGIVSVWTLVLISADRYRAIVKLQAHRSTLKGTLVRVVLIWLGALLFATPLAIFFRTIESAIEDGSGPRNVTVCSVDFPGPIYMPLIYSCVNIVVVFIIPLTIITRNYRAIMQKFSSSLKRMRDHMESAPRSHNSSVQAAAKMQREAHVVRMLIAMVAIFVVMWGPVTMFIVALMSDQLNQTIESYQLIIVFTVTYANTAVNPVVYGILNEQYQSQFRQLFSKVCDSSVHDNAGPGPRNSLRQVMRTLSGREMDHRFENSDDGCRQNVIDNICVETPS